MKRILFVGSHLGYPMDRTPLGGGAMVGMHLARRWHREGDFGLTVIGSGPESPDPTLDYRRIPEQGPQEDLLHLSELGYARFCRRFEREVGEYLERRRGEFPPEETCVVLNDVSEGPDPALLSRLGYPLLSIWHVDVVDYFNRMYFLGLVGPERFTRAYGRLEDAGLGRAVPDLLRLVFEKQGRVVEGSARLVVPSRGMAQTLLRCYGGMRAGRDLAGRLLVVPWGAWEEPLPEGDIAREAVRLRLHYRVGPDTRSLLTLSRISPEKGILLLLEALRRLEASGGLPAGDLCLFVCGEPAFMQGRSYERRVRRGAGRLRRARVFFPGYLSPREKQAYFRLAGLFVSPSIHESYGLSIVEALRAGLPVLASDHSGAEEILDPSFSRVVPYDGDAGGLWSMRSRHGNIPDRLAAALRELLDDPARLEAMGERARLAAEPMDFSRAARRVSQAALELAAPAVPA